ncbi:MAG: biotin/lipoate--protein ligase family protein [Xanthobacteraceae bacterium]
MPSELRSRIHTPYTPDLDLPPAFRVVTLREAGDAFDHAQKIAAKEGAGTLVWVRRFDIVEFAVVLEPEEPLAAARRSHYLALCALYDALAVHAPPEKLIQFVWPDAILVDGGLVAGTRLGWPKNADEKEPPAWLVFGAMVRTAIMGVGEPGSRPDAAALEDEGFDELGSGRLIETFARHLMVWTDMWQQDGFRPIAEHYLRRVGADEPVERSIDGVGDLLARRKGKLDTEKKKLVPALKQLAWYDAESRGLKL